MISVTRLNGKAFVVNAELIKTIESTPDTVVTLTNGERFIVREDLKEVVKRAVEYGRSIRVFAV